MTKRALWTLVSFFALISGCTKHQLDKNDVHRGGEWLAWTPTERAIYVDGYIMGYGSGAADTCSKADGLFEVNQSHGFDDHDQSTLPSARCRASLDRYTKGTVEPNLSVNNDAYSAVITRFYEKYPKYRNIPFFYLLSELSDSKYKSADNLYSLAERGELRTVF